MISGKNPPRGKPPAPVGDYQNKQLDFYRQAAAFHNQFNQQMPTPTAKDVLMRTPEEITAQLQARMAELEAQARDPKRMYPCGSCRWHEGLYRCTQPLMRGLDNTFVRDYEHGGEGAKLCGPEKALWEPIPKKKRSLVFFLLDKALLPAIIVCIATLITLIGMLTS